MINLISSIKKINKKYFVLVFMFIVLVSSFIVYKFVFNQKKQYTINSGFIEKLSENQGALVLDETIVEVENKSSIIPVIEEGKRTATGEVIATYRDKEYEEYITKIEQMGSEIETLINDLPLTYSADVSAIDKEISNISSLAYKTSSYVKMQEYKKNIDELCKKKVSLLSDLSPDGSKIRELTELRNKYEEESKKTGNNIKATTSGIVSYKVDSLEGYVKKDGVYALTVESIEDILNKYSSNSSNNFGIKVIDNYQAFLIIKEERGKNDEYMTIDKKYTIRIIDDNYSEITGKIVNIVQNDDYNYVIFEINNNIESIYDNRLISAQVVWKRVEGLAIPIKALNYDEDNRYYFVTTLKYGEYVNIPVEVSMSNDLIAIINNMDSAKKEEMKIEDTYNIKLYDRIVIE